MPPSDGVKTCFVAHLAYGSLSGKAAGRHVGGVERQQAMMARWLAARGQRVSMLTWDEGQPDGEEIDGVRVHVICRREAGLPGLRFFWPRWTGLVSAMRRADADVYYQNCGEYVTGQVALWCRRNRRKFVYSVANDPDCDVRLPEMRTLRERVLYRYGLRHADRVIVQTLRQQVMLREGFGVESTVIPMPCQGPGAEEYVAPEPPRLGEARVLWLARICEQKRPDRLVELARLCPELRFDFVGPANGEDAKRVVAQAAALPNVTVHGQIAPDQVHAFYQRSACLVCTSAFEGFPNTFLEAWSHGRPVVSTFDPDGLVAGRKLGEVAQDVPGLAAGLRRLLGSPARWLEASGNARRYYLENHAVEVVMPRFEQVFQDVVREDKQDARSGR
ncbi:MAG: glycosyltransferase family 4 protein [Planctomycetota bacterium]|nr:glycosyltransferase family 4 protein [Planctomycetota bacterium]